MWARSRGISFLELILCETQIPLRHTFRDRARALRREHTPAELRLWGILRGRRIAGAKFRRQVPIGDYIVDFMCKDAGLIVEVDGGQHSDQLEYDATRTAWLEDQGFRVFRFWNMDVLNETDAVIDAIENALDAASLSPAVERSRRSRG